MFGASSQGLTMERGLGCFDAYLRVLRSAIGNFGDDPWHKVAMGRRIDLLWRTIDGKPSDPVAAVQNWLLESSASALHLAEKAVVLIEPPELLGQTIWLFGQPLEGSCIRS